MNKKQKFMKFVAWNIIIMMIFTSIPLPAFGMVEESKENVLRVSDEYAEVYPNGVIEFAAVSIDTQEGIGTLDLQIIRKGGTEGKVSVEVKAIEVSATYDKDFSLLEKSFLSHQAVPKEFDSPTILESTLEDIREEAVTVDTSKTSDDSQSSEEDVDSNTTALEETTENETNSSLQETEEKEDAVTSDVSDTSDTSQSSEEEAVSNTTVLKDTTESVTTTNFSLQETEEKEVEFTTDASVTLNVSPSLEEESVSADASAMLEEESDSNTPILEDPTESEVTNKITIDETETKKEEEVTEDASVTSDASQSSEEGVDSHITASEDINENEIESNLSLQETGEKEDEFTSGDSVTLDVSTSLEEDPTKSDTTYKSSLHKTKDKVLGRLTSAEWNKNSSFKLFGVNSNEDIEVQEALSTVLPGASIKVDFDSGETIKVIKVKIIDDDVYEDDEVFNLGLYNIEGAVLGDACTVGVIVKDNDEPEEEKTFLEENQIFVTEDEQYARFKLVREGNIETFMKFSVKTLAGSAVSGQHYTTLIKEGVLLPGQTYKYIDVPVHKTGISEEKDFRLIVETDRGSQIEGQAWIMPSNGTGLTLMAKALDTGAEKKIFIKGREFTRKKTSGVKIKSAGNDGIQLKLNNGKVRSGSVEYDLDLVGIDQITTNFKITDINKLASTTEAKIWINGQTVNKFEKNMNSTTKTYSQFKRIKNGSITFKIFSNLWNDGAFLIYNISLRKQEISTSVEQADTFQVDVYKNADTVVGTLKDENGQEVNIIPGSIFLTDDNGNRKSEFYRDDIIRVNHNLTKEGEQYGAYLWGYELYDYRNGSWVPYSGDELTLSSDIILNHVYNSESYNNSLRIKPIFKRRSAGDELTVLEYGKYRGEFKIDGQTFNGGDVFLGRDSQNNVHWKVGDLLKVEMIPADGYDSKGIKDNFDVSLTQEGRGELYLPLTDSQQFLKPTFERNDAGVAIIAGENYDKVYVFGDQTGHIPEWEKNALYAGTEGLIGEERSQKILQNYDNMRNDGRFSARQINNLAIGEVVTLYAKVKEEGYIPRWIFKDGSDTILGSDSHVYTTHYGESFSFSMTSKDVEIEVGAVKAEDSEYILRGKTIKINNTLKGKVNYEKISLDNPESYQILPNVSLSVMTFDQDKYYYVDEEGRRYSISTTSDANGDFALYVPSVLKDHFFSVKLMNGEQVHATNITATDENVYIDLPFRDPDYSVTKIEMQYPNYSNAENNGTITIPKDPTTAARKVEVYTQTSSNNYRVSEVNLNSYSPEGFLIESIGLSRVGGSENLGTSIWQGDLNLAEKTVKGGRLTVEVFDNSGKSRGETETGYVILQEPPDMQIQIPAIGESFAKSGLSDIPVIGSDVPYVPDSYAETTIGEDMEIAILSGETLKQAINDNLERFDNESPWDKILFLTNYMSETYSINLGNKSENDTDQNLMHVGDIVKFPINFDIGLYLKISTAKDENDNGLYSLDYAFVTVGLGVGKTHHTNTMLFGFPVYFSLGAEVWGGGILGIMGDDENFLPSSFTSYRLIYLLGLYGKDPLEYTGIVDTDEINQQLLEAIYDQAGFAIELMPSKDDMFLSIEDDTGDTTLKFRRAEAEKYKEYMADRFTNLISGNWDFYKDNEDIFEAKKNEFTHDLKERIIRYKNEYMEKADDVENTITEDWIKRFNMLLLLESLPEYLQKPRTTFSAFNDSGEFDLNLENLKGSSMAGMISLKPRFLLGAGVGAKGYLSIGGSGHVNFVVNYQPKFDARGTVTWSLNLDIDLGVIPISVALVGDTYLMFETDGYRFSGLDEEIEKDSNAKMMGLRSRDLAVLDKMMENSSMISVDRNVKRVGSNQRLTKIGGGGMNLRSANNTPPLIQNPNATNQYLMDTTKHPQPKIHMLDDERMILFYLNDNLDRADYDRNSLFYSIYDGSSWSLPTELDEDGLLDTEFTTLKLEDGRIFVAWISAVDSFGDTLPDARDMMKSFKLKATVLEPDGNGGVRTGDITELTKIDEDHYVDGSFGMPKLTYDENTEKVLLTYRVTDYETEGVHLDYDDLENTIGNFMNNPFSTLAYHIYEDGTGWRTTYDSEKEQDAPYIDLIEKDGVNLNGLRYIDAGIKGLDNPTIKEYSTGTFQGKGYLAYTLDLDHDLSSDEDKELFALTFDYDNERFGDIVRLTDNMTDEANPQIVVSEYINSIFYGRDGDITSIDLEQITDGNLTYIDDGGYYTLSDNLNAEDLLDNDGILGYQSQEAAQSFSFTVGEDDNLYLTWNERSTEYADILDKEVYGRFIYVKGYDPKFEEIEEEEGGVFYSGSWGNKGPINYGDDVYFNEESLLITKDGNGVIATRSFDEMGTQSEKDSTGTKLVVAHMTLKSSIGIEETSTEFYPEIPSEGQYVTVSYSLENEGTFPSETVNLRTFLVTDTPQEEEGDLWFLTDTYNGYEILKESLPKNRYYKELDETKIEGHFSSGGLLNNNVEFEMPAYNKDVELYIVAWENDNENYPNVIRLDVPIESVIESENVTLRLSDDKSEVKVEGSISNYGNDTAKDLQLELINQGNYDYGDIILDEGYAQIKYSDYVSKTVETFSIGDLAPGETYHIGYTIKNGTDSGEVDFSKFFNSAGEIHLEMKATYKTPDGVARSLSIGNYTYTKEDSSAVMISDIRLINGGDDSIDDQISISEGESRPLTFKMEPFDAAKNYRLEYRVADTEIASIDSVSGVVSGQKEGETEIIIEAYQLKGLAHLASQGILNNEKEDQTDVVMVKKIPLVVSKSDVEQKPRGSSDDSQEELQEDLQKYSQEKSTENNILETEPVLSGDFIQTLVEDDRSISVTFDNIQYIIPTKELEIGKIAEQLGVEEDALEEYKVEIKIDPVDENESMEIEENARSKGYELVSSPVQFEIVATAKTSTGVEKEVLLSEFNQYVRRVIQLPEGVDPTRTMTGVVYHQDGTFSPVPTSVWMKDGKYYAQISSLTNSIYMIISNPVTVDTVENHWSKETVNDLASRLVISSPEKFLPDREITRGEFAEYITKALGLRRTEGSSIQQFSDVPTENTLADAIETASAYGIIKGYPDGSFRPEAKISREEAMAMYSRAMDIAGIKEKDNDRFDHYIDKSSVSNWAYNDVKKTVNVGIFNGKTDHTINPQDTFTCAEAAAAIRNLLSVSGLIN